MFIDNNLDIKQQEAVDTNYKNVEVCAPPGSGKTTVIINRVCNLIENRKVKPHNIIVITFTKAAAVNMKKRYLNISKGTNNTPFFGTFHSLFYKILSKYTGKINIIEQEKSYEIVKHVLNLYMDSVSDEKVKKVLNDISFFKNQDSSIYNFDSSIDRSVFIDCFESYEEYKAKNSLMDFDDLQLKSKRLFLQRNDVLCNYRKLFKYILVDEFQDCDRLQIELLQLISYSNSIFAVGDEDQCIYSFRGSNPECMVNFHKYFDGGRKIFLSTNYRSNKNIVDISKALISNNKNRNSKIIKENKETIGKINFSVFERKVDESNYVSDKIKEFIDINKVEVNDIAVLYRTNIESRSIIDSFLKNNIKFKFLDKKYNFFEHFICQDIIAYLKLSVDEYDRNSFIKIINKPYRYVSKINIHKLRKYPVKENCFDILRGIDGLPIFQIKNMGKLKRKISKLSKIRLDEAVDLILNKLGYINYLKEYCNKVNTDISEVEDIIEEFKDACYGYNNIKDFLEYVEEFSNSIKDSLTSNADVIISSIHGVKGMEFKNVFIINCNEGIIPHSNSIPKSIEEERRLFYVGITRTIENLELCSVKTINGKTAKVSRFIEECEVITQ